jgi:HK97 family phage major capsid protein
MVALRNYDEIFSKDAITFFETHRGTSIVIPFADDTQNQATVIPEASQAEAEVDPIIQPAQQSSIQTSAAPMAGYLPLPPTWRSGMVKVSIEMLQDSAFDIVGFLAEAFAVRFARGIGANIVSTTLAGAKLGVTATGSAANTGGSETGGVSIGWKDLVNMRLAVDAAYRRSPKAAWCMNDNTLGALEGILNKYGTPLFPPSYTASGIRRILGFPVRLCPSMPSIGLSAKSVLFGDLSYLVLRVVKNSVGIRVYKERFADYGQIGFRGFMRAQSALVAESTVQTTFPILYLQNASA